MVQDKAITVAMIIPHIDFVILEEFNDLVEDKPSIFSVLSKVLPELKQVSRAIILIKP